jgi:hypothetical protein
MGWTVFLIYAEWVLYSAIQDVPAELLEVFPIQFVLFLSFYFSQFLCWKQYVV